MFRKITVSPNLILLLAVMFLTVPMEWCATWVLAAVVHELCHCAGVILCGGRIMSVHVCPSGTRICADIRKSEQEVFCLLAGPVGALSLLAFSSCFPRLALCAVVQSAYNLLPLPDLDGGQVFRIVSDCLLTPPFAETLCSAFQNLTVLSVVLFCITASLTLRLGVLPIFLAGIFLLRHGKIKIPCKERCQAVQ